MKVKGKVAAVVGGASGLGQACAEALLVEGARVAVLDDKPIPAGLRARDPDRVSGWQVDLTDGPGVESVFDQILGRFGPVQILVNALPQRLDAQPMLVEGRALPLADFQRVVRGSLLASINTVRCAAAHMIGRFVADGRAEVEHGVIVNTASIVGLEGRGGLLSHAAANGGLAAMTLPLTRELGRYGIRVNTLALGAFDTLAQQQRPGDRRDVWTNLRAPFPPRPGTGDEFAEIVLGLVCSTMVNGAVVRVDGGLRLPYRN